MSSNPSDFSTVCAVAAWTTSASATCTGVNATWRSAGAPGRFPKSKGELVSVPSCKHAPRFATHRPITAPIVVILRAECRQLLPRAAALWTHRDEQRHRAALRRPGAAHGRLTDDPSRLYVRAVRRVDGGGETHGCEP